MGIRFSSGCAQISYLYFGYRWATSVTVPIHLFHRSMDKYFLAMRIRDMTWSDTSMNVADI